MYNNPYFNYSQQNNIDMLNNQIAELEKRKNQLVQNQQQPSINQTFQLAPNNSNTIKYASSISDVNKELVFGDTPFFNKEMTKLWLKNSKGEVKIYEINEIVEKDEKDLMIENLQKQIYKLNDAIKEMNTHEPSSNEYVEPEIIKPSETTESTNISTVRTNKKK